MSSTPTTKQINSVFAQLEELRGATQLLSHRIDNWAKRHQATKKDSDETHHALRDAVHKLESRVAVHEAQIVTHNKRIEQVEQVTSKVTTPANSPAVPPMRFIIAYGNAFDGMTVVGPFNSADAAHKYLDDDSNDEDWRVVLLQEPAEEPKS